MNKRKFTLLAGLCAATLASGFGNAAVAGKLEDILARGKLIVGTGLTNPPWHFRDEKGEMAGYDVDMAKILAKGLFGDETKIEFVNQASDARIPNLVTDKVDITCQGMTVTAERAQQVNFTIPYYREGVGLMMTAGGKYKSRDEMKAAGSAVTVSVLQNVYAEEMVHYALPEAKVDQYESFDLMYQALEFGPVGCSGNRHVIAAVVHDPEPGQVCGRRLWLESANLFLRRQARRAGLAELRQHRLPRRR